MSLMPIDQALAIISKSVTVVKETEVIPLDQALGRVLCGEQVSEMNVPPADNSAVDGYVIHADDYEEGKAFRVSQRITAGSVPQPLEAGTVARIFTGAEVPENGNAVFMQEDSEVLERTDGQESLVKLSGPVSAQKNIRPRGQDITKGQRVLSAGHRLLPQDQGLLASIGIDKVSVYRRLKVAVISTGDELVEPGAIVSPGQIYNSNRYTLKGLISGLGMECLDFGIVEDNPQKTEETLKKAAAEADCVITSGGVSVGQEDHVKASVEKLGAIDLWKLAIKPGKPLAFGHIAKTPFIGLPGNPAAVFITFVLVARPFLLSSQGAVFRAPLSYKLPLLQSVGKAGKRQDYRRAQLVTDEAGNLSIDLFPNQSSGVLTSISWADGLAVFPVDQTFDIGDQVEFIPLSELLN